MDLSNLVLSRTPVAIALSYRAAAAHFFPELDDGAIGHEVHIRVPRPLKRVFNASYRFFSAKLLVSLLLGALDVDGGYAHGASPLRFELVD